MKKSKKLILKKVKVSILNRNQSRQVYGGTMGQNGCGDKSELGGAVCNKTKPTKNSQCPDD